MSGFVCVFERCSKPVDPGHLDHLAKALEIYGQEATTLCRGPVGITLRHRGGPGAWRRHGPLEDPGSGQVVAVAGQFAPLMGRCGVDSLGVTASRNQPAAYATQALSRSPAGGVGESGTSDDLLAGVSGAFVLIVAHPGSGSIEVARDHLGSSKVYYALNGDRLIAASEPAAIIRHGTVPGDLDEGSIARFLGFRFGLRKQSFFKEIRELPPGHRLRVTANDATVRRYWRFRPKPSTTRSPEEITAAFRRGLSRAIADDVAGLEPHEVALSLSGGLDSTALAALAPRGLQAFSWTFQDTPSADERSRIEQVAQHLKLPVSWVLGDGLYPLCDDFVARFVDENSPYLNPFSALKDRLYQAARAAGCKRVLVGDAGDAHYAASEYWLRDALAAGEPRVLSSLASTAVAALKGDIFARRSLKRALPFARFPRLLRPHPAPWLTAAARDLLGEERSSPILPAGSRGGRQELSVGVKHSELESEEQRLFARCGVERGNPFWSWPLLELTIHLSALWYRYDKRTKVLTREALRGLLPEQVLEGAPGGSLGEFFLRGIERRREDLREKVFRRPRSNWSRYVRKDWVEPFLSATRSIAFGHTILWRVIAYELWYRRLLRGERGNDARPPSEGRARNAKGDGRDNEVAGRVYGVTVRGRLPASFHPYLLPVDRSGEVDTLKVSYRRIDGVPEVEEIWTSKQTTTNLSPQGARFALVRRDDCFSLVVSDHGSGIFHCEPGRIEIEWTAGGTGAPHYFFTYALPLWLETRGVPVLHGSAVLVRDRAVGFVGPSGVGKSVLAADLTRQGCGLVADDGLVLRRDYTGAWRAFLGPPILRLWPSALRLLGIGPNGLTRVHETLEKRQLSLSDWNGDGTGPGSDPPAGSARLAGLYILERGSGTERPVRTSTVSPAQGLVQLIGHSVAAAPAAALGLSAQRFELLADVAQHVPLYRLNLPGGAGWAAPIRERILGDLASVGLA